MLNDPDQTLYKLYVEKEMAVDKIDALNFRFGMDQGPKAPENPEIM